MATRKGLLPSPFVTRPRDTVIAAGSALAHKLRVESEDARAGRIARRYDALVAAGREDEADALFDLPAPVVS